MMDVNAGLVQWFRNILIKKASATSANKFYGSRIKNENIANNELVEELHKPILRKFKKKKYTHLL